MPISYRAIKSFISKQNQAAKNQVAQHLDLEPSSEESVADNRPLNHSKQDALKEALFSVSEKHDLIPSPTALQRQNFITKEGIGKSEIESFVYTRRILNLVHFTQVEKLAFILEEGILSNEKVRQLQRPVLDANRHDKRPGHVCISISFPNYQMFYSYHKGDPLDWCVVLIDPKVLMQKDCLFFPYNAASNELSRRPDSAYLGISALQRLYADKIQSVSRKQNLQNSFPTSPQAEVLIPDQISVEDIKSIHFSDFSAYNSCQKLLSDRNILGTVSKKYFLPRLDWSDWS